MTKTDKKIKRVESYSAQTSEIEKDTWSEVVNPLIVSPPTIAIPLSPRGCKITAYRIEFSNKTLQNNW